MKPSLAADMNALKLTVTSFTVTQCQLVLTRNIIIIDYFCTTAQLLSILFFHFVYNCVFIKALPGLRIEFSVYPVVSSSY